MSHGEPGRNDLCPCGSGKKFKKCHLGMRGPPPSRLNVSLEERNTIFVDAVREIFELGRGTWYDVKLRVTADRVRELYRAHQFIWGAHLSELLPQPSSKLTSLFLGQINPEDLALRIFRFGLYTERILVLNPFTFPAPLGRHPIEDPASYVRDTLQLVYFVARMEPWIRAGFVTLIGDPVAYDPQFRADSMNKAEVRATALGGLDPRDIENGEEDMRDHARRWFGSMPRSSLEAHVRETHPDWAVERRTELVEHMIKSNADDPLGLPPFEDVGPGAPPPREMVLTRHGTTLESALLICDTTGAFPYTESHTKWRELLSAAESFSEHARTWSPLTNAFQSLDFHFLNNVDASFAKRIREEGRLVGFRQFLRDLWGKIGGDANPDRSEMLAREFSERLTEEHRRAEEDWKKIDRDTLASQAPNLTGLLGSGAMILSGGITLQAGLIATAIGAVSGLSTLARAKDKRKEFRVQTPMSVFVDLKRHKRREGPAD